MLFWFLLSNVICALPLLFCKQSTVSQWSEATVSWSWCKREVFPYIFVVADILLPLLEIVFLSPFALMVVV